MSIKYYTGCGTTSTPVSIRRLIQDIAASLAKEGYILRTGGEKGGDEAFEEGCNSVDPALKELYLPFGGFNGKTGVVFREYSGLSDELREMGMNTRALTKSSRLRMGRCYQELEGLNGVPSEFLICYDSGEGTPNFIHRLAIRKGIKVYNLYDKEVRKELCEELNQIGVISTLNPSDSET